MNPALIAQGQGYVRRYLELDVEAGRPGAQEALEWFNHLDSGLDHYRHEANKLATIIQNVKIAVS